MLHCATKSSLIDMAQTGHQSYESFREMLNLPAGDGEGPQTLPLPVLPIPPFVVPASEAAAKAPAEEEELEEMTVPQGASRDVTQSPKTCKLRLDNFVEPDSEDENEVEPDPSGDVLPGMVPSSTDGQWTVAVPETTAAPRAVALLHRPMAVRAPAVSEDADPEGLLASIGHEWGEEDDDAPGEGAPEPDKTGDEPDETESAAEPPADGGEEGVLIEGVEAFSLDPGFDYENVKCTGQRFSVDRAMREGEFYDRT